MTWNRPASAGAILESLLRKLDFGGRIRQNMAIAFWPQVVGPAVAAACTAEEVKDGILYVRTPGSTWSQELSLLKHEILPRLNERLGGGVIQDIKFRSGQRKNKEHTEVRHAPTREELAQVTLTDEDQAELNKVTLEVASITDEELRKVTLRLAERAVRLNRWRVLQGWQPCRVCSVLVPPGESFCTLCAVAEEE